MSRRFKGFSLIEILVAIAIGILSMVVMLQIFANSEGQKRTMTAGSDAQTNGVVGLYLIERDVRMAGWGLDPALYLGTQKDPLPALPLQGCNTVLSYCDGSAACGSGTETGANFSFASVRITDGANGGPDTLAVRFFANPTDDHLDVPMSGTYMGNDQASYTLATSIVRTCGPTDLILVSDATVPVGAPGTCTILQATSVTPGVYPAASFLAHTAGAASPFNSNANWPAAASAPTSNAKVTCFKHPTNGPAFKRVFSIDANQALVKSDNTVNPVLANEVVASAIVDLQAQYGIAADQQQNVAAWVDGVAPWDNPAPKPAVPGATTDGRLQNIKAVRVTLLARSAQFEKPDPTTGVCSATTAAMVAAWPKRSDGQPVFKTPTTAQWDCYRYKVFDTIIPLRTIIWANI